MAASMIRRQFLRAASNKRNIYLSPARGIHITRVLMAAHDAEFEDAKNRLGKLKEDPGNEVKLKIYALFKQATQGKCNTPKPGMMDIVGKYKWAAWNELGDMSKDEAQLQYIKLVNDLAGAEQPTETGGQTQSEGKYETVAINNSDGIYQITLNRPDKKNAINYKMYEEWQLALKEAAEDKNVVVAVVTGAGDYYCSGNDLGNFANIPPDGVKAMAEEGGRILQKFVSAFIEFPKPLIGLINGPAVGVSVTTLGLFDVVYATDRATFQTPFSNLGQSPEGCSSYIFPKLMGTPKASEILLFNKKITAVEACDRNLVTEVFPDHAFKSETEKRLKEYAKLPKMSLQKSKFLSREIERETLHKVNQLECDVLVERWQSEECFQAIMNFFSRKDSKL